jgi:hypothetical protein
MNPETIARYRALPKARQWCVLIVVLSSSPLFLAYAALAGLLRGIIMTFREIVSCVKCEASAIKDFWISTRS